MKKLAIAAAVLGLLIGGTVSRASLDKPTDLVTRAELENVEIARVEMLANIKKSTVIINSWFGKEVHKGSGFFVAKDWIMTAEHVIENDPDRITIVKQDGTTDCVIQRILPDKFNDLALINVSTCTGYPIPVSYSPKTGQDIYAIGNPGEYDYTVTKGIIGNTNGARIQFDADIHPGNSGGPLINSKGEAIGVVAANGESGDGVYTTNGVNMAVFMSWAKWELENIVGVERR